MRPIPKKLRERLPKEFDMETCVNCGCEGSEWNHVWKYAGRQINEIWSIVPLCTFCHRGNFGTIYQEAKIASERESIRRLVDSGLENIEKYQKLGDTTWNDRIIYYDKN